jgi:hypothetical protein
MLPKPTSKGLKTWPDEDRAKINPRGKVVAVETKPVWLLFEPDLGWYSVLRAEFSLWGVRVIGFVDAQAMLIWLLQLIERESKTDVPQLAVVSLDQTLIFQPGMWDWFLHFCRPFEIFQGMAIVLLHTGPLSPNRAEAISKEYPKVKRAIPIPLPPMNVLRKMLFEAAQS